MNFAYLDSDDVLRITHYKRVAMTQAKNKQYIETDFPALYGYPIDNKEKIIVMYNETKERNNKPIPQELVDLYKLLKRK